MRSYIICSVGEEMNGSDLLYINRRGFAELGIRSAQARLSFRPCLTFYHLSALVALCWLFFCEGAAPYITSFRQRFARPFYSNTPRRSSGNSPLNLLASSSISSLLLAVRASLSTPNTCFSRAFRSARVSRFRNEV